jgi:hypothetical protein
MLCSSSEISRGMEGLWKPNSNSGDATKSIIGWTAAVCLWTGQGDFRREVAEMEKVSDWGRKMKARFSRVQKTMVSSMSVLSWRVT